MNVDIKAVFQDMRVLIVDDDREIRNLLEMMLREMDIKHVARVNDGRQAHEYLEDDGSQINLIICDWKMPRMDGLELLKLVRKTHPDMPFMMISGLADLQLVESARDDGVTAVIAKPFSRAQVLEKMRYIAGQLAAGTAPAEAAPAAEAAPEAEASEAGEEEVAESE